MISSSEQVAAINDIAAKEYPREAVIAVLGDGSVRQLDNIARAPREEFLVSNGEWLSVADSCKVLVHSHPDGPYYPSESDMRTQIALSVPFGIVVSTPHDAGGYFEWGGDRAPLLNRPFRHGVTDCYGLIRDYYSTTSGVSLPDFAREWEWWEHGKNMYVDNFMSAGFNRVSANDVRPGDMIMFKIRREAPCHAGIYTGNGEIIHHLGGSKGYDPTRYPMTDGLSRWQKFVHSVYRHKDC